MIDDLAARPEAKDPGIQAPPLSRRPSSPTVTIFGLAIWLTIDNATDFASHSADYTARINALLTGGAPGELGLASTPKRPPA